MPLSVLRVQLRAVPRCTRVSVPQRPFYSSSSRRSYYNRGFLGFLDNIPQQTVFWGIIGLNGAVFTGFWWAKKKLQVERDPRLYWWMRKNFTSNWQNLSSGRVWTLFTSAFAHQDLAHILFNGFTFYFLTPLALSILVRLFISRVEIIPDLIMQTGKQAISVPVSRRHVLNIFPSRGSGAAAQLGSTAFTNIFQNGRDPYSLGASAAIYSTISFLAFSAPRMTLLLYGIIPVPIWLAVSGIFAYDTYLTAADKGGTTNTSAHVGGILAGAGYFFLRRFRIL
ncbi:RHOMBOID-like protein 12, mitochondrial [Mycena venus]|uniref:RHOMBOID-like protein 12, mitochondrial n=1 Tax=Mycena venus TaxID=2733690 RepID=A0A8H6Y5W0_9AGAR|nr:RHOMBOID-like protein 12, mitochondrial [Mycena venus]